MKLKKNKTLQSVSLPVGMISLATGIILSRYFPASNTLDFITGVLFGLSIVLNIFYLYTGRMIRKSNSTGI